MGPGTLNVASGEPVLLKTSVRMPGDCTVTHSERTTHLGLRGDFKLPCMLIPFQAVPILFAAHPIVPLSTMLHGSGRMRPSGLLSGREPRVCPYILGETLSTLLLILVNGLVHNKQRLGKYWKSFQESGEQKFLLSLGQRGTLHMLSKIKPEYSWSFFTSRNLNFQC